MLQIIHLLGLRALQKASQQKQCTVDNECEERSFLIGLLNKYVRIKGVIFCERLFRSVIYFLLKKFRFFFVLFLFAVQAFLVKPDKKSYLQTNKSTNHR